MSPRSWSGQTHRRDVAWRRGSESGGGRSTWRPSRCPFAQHLIKDGLVALETVHTKVNTADMGTKYPDAPTMRRLVGLLGVRLLTLDRAEEVRCDDERRVQEDGWIVFSG